MNFKPRHKAATGGLSSIESVPVTVPRSEYTGQQVPSDGNHIPGEVTLHRRRRRRIANQEISSDDKIPMFTTLTIDDDENSVSLRTCGSDRVYGAGFTLSAQL